MTVALTFAAPAAAGNFTVRKLLTLDDKPATYYIIGVYEGFNLARTVDKQWTCWAPKGTSNASVAAMVRDEWRAHPDEYNDVVAEAGIGMVICKLWRQRLASP